MQRNVLTIPTPIILTWARQDIIVVKVHLVCVFSLQVRFENEVDKLPVVIVIHVGDVGIIQLAIWDEAQTHGHPTALRRADESRYDRSGRLTVELVVSVRVVVPEFDVEVAPGVDQRSCSQQEEEDGGGDDGSSVVGATWARKWNMVGCFD